MNVGILGGGQLGWMTILEGRKLGINFLVLDPNPNAPASRIADAWFPPEKVEEFYRGSDVITYEFEHIEDEVLESVEGKLIPNPLALRLKKDRGEEKGFLYKHGYPVPRFRRVKTEELKEAVSELGLPAVVKSTRLGYDGKGQYRIRREEDLGQVFKSHSEGESFVVEEFVDFELEASAVGVRDSEGRTLVFPITMNVHDEGILLYNYTVGKAPWEKELVDIIVSLLEDLKIVGLLAVEFFITKKGDVLINEFAPRPHNTAHYTLDGTFTSQFENLLRAILGLPLGSTQLKLPTGMVNILGLPLKEINLPELLSVKGSRLYWYGKEPKPRRKVGHVNIVSGSLSGLKERLERILKILYQREYALR